MVRDPRWTSQRLAFQRCTQPPRKIPCLSITPPQHNWFAARNCTYSFSSLPDRQSTAAQQHLQRTRSASLGLSCLTVLVHRAVFCVTLQLPTALSSLGLRPASPRCASLNSPVLLNLFFFLSSRTRTAAFTLPDQSLIHCLSFRFPGPGTFS